MIIISIEVEEVEEYQINHYWMLKTFDLWSPESFEESGIDKCFIARNSEDIIGFLTTNQDNQAVAIEVLPQYRNKGVGLALLNEANCYAPERDENEEFWEKIKVLKLMAERPEMVESVIDLIVADTISTLVETDSDYSHLLTLFIRSGEDIVENYKSAKQDIDLSLEYRCLTSLVEDVINNIGSDLFTDMLDTDENSAFSEVLRGFGYGVSFWDNHRYSNFGFSERPKLKTTLVAPYLTACSILDKITEAHPEYTSEEETEDGDFDKWLASNYSPAGEDASNGEQWFLSNSPHEFMPISLSKLKERWEKENYIQELPGSELLDGIIFENLSEEEHTELENQLAERGVLHFYQ